MRIPGLLLVSLPVITTAAAFAQDAEYEALKDQYCEICPYDAPVTPGRRDNFSVPTRTTTIITPDDMRALGVVSAADMIRQIEEDVADSADATELPAPANESADEEID